MTDDASSEWRTLPPAARTVAMISGVLLALPVAVAIGCVAAIVFDAGVAPGLALCAAISLALCAIAPFAGGAAVRAGREG